MKNLAAFTQAAFQNYPGYVSINQRDDGVVVVSVRAPENGGEKQAEVEISREELSGLLTDALCSLVGLPPIHAEHLPHAAEWGGVALFKQALALCHAIEALPASTHATEMVCRVSDAYHGLAQLQAHGEYVWPRPVVATLEATNERSARVLLAEVHAWREADRQSAFPHELRQRIATLLAT